jgi:hypothetical protein
MNKGGPIIIIEDDPEILGLVFKELNYKNEIIFLVIESWDLII